MKANHRTHRLLALMLALILVLTTIPTGAIAAGTTIAGSPETVEMGQDAAAHRENDFNKGWKFYLGNNSSASNTNFDDSAWADVDLPHDFSITQSFTTSGEAESGFLPGGTGWYRKSFIIGEESAGKTFLLNFDGVYMHAYVYVNGNFVGEHHYGYTSFAFDITEHLICDGTTENVVAVKAVNNTPSSRWYSGSGIYRDVTLYAMDSVHVDLHGVTVTTPAQNNGSTVTTVDVVNDSAESKTVTVSATAREKGFSSNATNAAKTVTIPAGQSATVELTATNNVYTLWSIEDPNLWTMHVEVSVDGSVVDTYETDYGYRWFEFNSTGFHLNGEAVKLNGVCMHHDQGGLGSAAYYDAIYRQMSIMKDMGANAIRTAHNPADEDLIAICNELGLLVIEEAFDGLHWAKNGNSNDFSTHFNQTASDALYGFESGMTCAEFAARSMVNRDKNAPAIIAWSFGNEIQEGSGTSGEYVTICENFINWVKDEDDTRPVTIGDNTRGSNSTLVNVISKILNAGGIAGFNYANTVTGSGDRALDLLIQNYSGSNGCIIASETSSATNSRGRYQSQSRNTPVDGAYHLTSYDTSAVDWGITAHDSIYNTYYFDAVAGEFVWTGFDYIGEPTPKNGTSAGSVTGAGPIPNSSYFGIVETTGFEKDSFYLYRSQWNKDATTVHLVTAWDSDNYMVSSNKTPVWLYSNAPKVELYLNGTKIATATRKAVTSPAGHTYYTYTSTSNNTSVCTVSNGSGSSALYAVFNVAYSGGTLSTKAYDANGRQITLDDSMGRHTVSTPGTVTKLQASVNKTEIAADGSSLAYVEIDVTDASGNLKTTAANNITFTLSGPGEIAAVDNGDQATTAKYQQASVLTSPTAANINAYAGKALVIIRSTEEAGEITLNIASSGLTGQTIKINTVADSESVADGLVSYTMVRDYSVKVGTTPALSTDAVGTLSDGTTITGTIDWDSISVDMIHNAGDYTITGTMSLEGLEPMTVTAKLHVIPNVIDLRNVSAATMEGSAPTLPDTVRGVLADGTLAGEFAVEWDAPAASVYDTVGEIVTVNGTAAIFGDEIMDVTCTVRVAEAVNTESTNVAGVAHLSQDIPTNMQSDNLNAINDGVRNPGNDTNDRWTNWNNRYTSDTATITLRWDTAQVISDLNMFYRYDNSASKPDQVVISYSLDGSSFIEIGHTESALNVAVSNGAAFTYALEQPINPVAIQVTFTQTGGTSGGRCVGLYELEAMTYAGAITVNSSADLSAVYVDGTAIQGFTADTLAYEAAGSAVTADTAVNAGITVLPNYEGVVRVLTVSEDGSAARTYAITVGEEEVCAHEHTELRDAREATCTTDGYTGDLCCTDCGALLTSGTVSAATGHSWSAWSVTKAATCTETGSRSRSCAACGETENETIAATGHLHTELRGAQAATCTDAGYSGDTWCTDCGVRISTGSTIAAKGHSWNSGVVTKEPTETEDGIKTYTCTVCSATRTEAVPYQKALKAPSVSLILSTDSSGRIVMTGQVNDYANLEDYCNITAHGIVYIQTSRIGTRTLTLNTSGRTKVGFSAYKDDGSYTYSLKPASKTTSYTIRAFVTYTDPDTGASITVYSDMRRNSYNSLLP